MAYTQILDLRLYEFEQPEITETKEVVNDNGEVVTQTTVVQEYVKTWVNLTVSQEQNLEENYSNIRAYINAYAQTKTKPFTFSKIVSSTNYLRFKDKITDTSYYSSNSTSSTSSKTVQPGVTSSLTLATFYSTSVQNNWHIYHNFIDGLRSIFVSGAWRYSIETEDETFSETFGRGYAFTDTQIDLKPIDKSTKINTASNFTDEENPTFTYTVFPVVADLVNNHYYDYPSYKNEEIAEIQIALSFDGETADIPYRAISKTGTSYTFTLTDAEREILRQKTQGSNTVPIYFITKTLRVLHYNRNGTDSSSYGAIGAEFYNKVARNLTIVGCNPTLNPIVKDIKEETLALTGDENTFIRYESMAEFAINATASKHATIVSQSVTCGSKTIEGLPYGVIDNVESGTFNFYVTDSRNMGAASAVFKEFVEYVKPTCYQKAEIEITGETGATIRLKVNGSYFNGSFGATDNTFKLEVRHTDGNDNWGEWTTITGTPTFNGNTYELEATFTGFDYGKTYTFQCRTIDELNVVESAQYVVSMLPAFDWSKEDFNFNVPVNIDADNLNMHGETIIRHSETTNNTVLSANNGHIYIRPGGTDNTSGQTIFYNNGNIDISGNTTFGGTVNFNHSFTIGGYILNDYVIETGEETMGSNGTWYWRKWLSGKAECWGCRNFGNMGVSTAWGSLYRSAVFTQDLPEDVFNTTPDAININFVHTNAGGWISKYSNTAPSAITTGSFVVVRPVSGNITPTNIGFYVVGRWY